MTPAEDPVTDADLHAWVDGQLDPARAAAVLAWLVAHPDDARRVVAWQSQRFRLRALEREIASEMDSAELPPALTDSVRRAAGSSRQRANGPLAAAAALLLAVGLAGGYGLAPSVSRSAWAGAPAFVHDAVVAHAVYTPEKRHAVEVAASDEAHLVQWLGRRLGLELKAPALGDQGFRLLGGRLLPGAGAARAHFMYENAQGKRLTLYLASFKPGQAPAETSFRSAREGERESFYWVEGSFGYALSAELPAAEVQVLAREVHRQLSRR